MNTIEDRVQRAAESILENEALTADLDDEAARVVLDWGVARARQIAAETGELEESAAEEAMYRPMRALRKMLRAVTNWVLAPDEAGLEKILEQARIIYEAGYAAPSSDQVTNFVDQIDSGLEDLPERVRLLRAFIENQKRI